jgi:nucleotide-binding universal stress UspA family protein
MYGRILVPVVVPANVGPLVKMASYLLEPNGEIDVLHVITAKSMPEMTKGWRNSLQVVIPAHETGAALDVRVVPEVKVAPDAAVEILERAETQKADAIVMTLSGFGKKRINPFFGHTTSAILHHATCDVIIVNRLALIMNRIGKILIPSFTVQPAHKVMLAAEAVSAKKGGVPIVTLHMLQGNAAASPDSAHTFVGTASKSPKHLKTVLFPSRLFHRRSALPDMFLEVTRREGYGLCLVGEEGRGVESPLLTRSFIEDLFSRSPCPVMVLKGL